jgi:phage terminase large subunit-like protein
MTKYHFDQEAATKPTYFIEKYCKHLHGKVAGKPFLLADWQKSDIIEPAFGWKDSEGRRKHRFVYVELPKGNGKSALLSGICLYVACFDGEKNAEIYCVAGDRQQARIIFDTCKEMVNADKDLSKACIVRRDHIEHKKSGSKIKVISAEAYGKHGYRPYFIAFDELHVQPNRELYDTLTRGLIKRWNSMCFMITTAGVKNTFAESMHDYATDILTGKSKNDAWLPVIYNADLEDDPFEEETWLKANPGIKSGIIDLENFRILAQEAHIPSALNAFKQLHLNIWTGSVMSWIPPHTWKLCQGVLPPQEYLSGLDCYVGFDKSATTDLTAITAIWDDKDNQFYYMKVWTLCPEATIYDKTRKENINYAAWVRDEWLIATPGNTQDDRALLKVVMDICEVNKVKVVAYDSWNASSIAAELFTDHDIFVFKVQQSLSVLSEPTKWFEKVVNDGQILDNSNPIFAWALDNTNIFLDPNGNYRPHKGKSKGRIDPVAATVTAVTGMLHYKKENPELHFFGEGFTFI